MHEKARIPGPKAGRWLILIGSVVLLVAGLRAAEDFFLPILPAFFVATVRLPITTWLVRRRFPARWRCWSPCW
jgi:predicted PurR-regulated permease PerM